MSKKFVGLSPKREIMNDIKEYLKSWNEILKPIEEMTGWKRFGFDPSCQFVDSRGKVITLTVGQVEDLLKVKK